MGNTDRPKHQTNCRLSVAVKQCGRHIGTDSLFVRTARPTAVALLQIIGKSPSKHSDVISLFDTEFVLKEVFPKTISKDFHHAFDLRQASDYQPIDETTLEYAADLPQKTQCFAEMIYDYFSVQLHFYCLYFD